MSKDCEPVILIAEDNEDDVFMLRRAFARIAVQAPVHVVSNGEQAIAYLKGVGTFANRQAYPLPDIVLLDLKMPRKNGFDVLQWWQEQPHLSAIRIVVLTSSEEVRDVTKAYKLGAASFLFKSLTYPILSMYQYWRNNIHRQNSRDSVRQALGLC